MKSDGNEIWKLVDEYSTKVNLMTSIVKREYNNERIYEIL